MTPQRIQRKRTKGWRMPEGAVYVGRPTKWGNPWRVVPLRDHHFPFGDAADVVHVEGDRFAGRFERRGSIAGTGAPYWATQMFKLHIHDTPGLLDSIRAELVGRDLACWCPLSSPCHADVLLQLANEDAP
ncbi:MAG: hypothetical protein JWM93_2460 [Frankiales bacterium]|nr:hypothetical protein [Frankiales bacterium]